MASKASTSLIAQREAQEVEGIFTPTPEEVALVERWRELRDRVRAVQVEMDAIVASLKGSMDSRDAAKLFLDGTNVAQYVDTTSTVVNVERMRAAVPGIVAAYEQAQFAFQAEAPRFTEVKVNPHARFLVR